MTRAYRVLVCVVYQSPRGSMVNCAVIIVSPICELESSILNHALFIFYIINGITQLNAINPCELHMECGWVISYSLCSDVDSMLSRWSSWSPGGLLLDSRWILDKELVGIPPKIKCLNSIWTPGVDLESTRNMWGSVKSSATEAFEPFNAVIQARSAHSN